MKTASQIKFDFQQAKKRAAELEEIAEDMRRLAKSDLENTMGNLSAAWKGDSSRQYLTKAARLQEEITATSRDLNNIADTIRRIAAIIYDAEMKALQIATQRDS